MNRPRVLMIGPGRNVKGGITTVVNNYYDCGLDKQIVLKYIPTMEDGTKLRKLFVAARAYQIFCASLKNYDIVHVHMAGYASFDRKALFIEQAKKAGKKIIIHQHAADFDRYFSERVSEQKRRRIRKIFSMADKVIALSEEWSGFYGEKVCDPGKIVVIHNGVPAPEFSKTDYCDRNVLVLGRLGERKGTYDLLKSIPAVLKAVPDAVFYLGGDGDEKLCRKIADETGIGGNVNFLGWVSGKKKDEYLKKCSTYILPSHYEGMPMSLLEAMSCGLASISTNVGGIPQVIENNVNGIIINAGDVNAISDSLIRVLENEDMRRNLGQAAKARISEKFSLTENMNVLMNLYLSV